MGLFKKNITGEIVDAFAGVYPDGRHTNCYIISTENGREEYAHSPSLRFGLGDYVELKVRKVGGRISGEIRTNEIDEETTILTSQYVEYLEAVDGKLLEDLVE